MINLLKSTGRVRIESRDPLICIQTHIFRQTSYRLRKRSYWIQPNLFVVLLTQVGEQEHYRFLFFGSPFHGPQWVCIFWLCCLFLNCWVELNQICEQLKQIVYTRAYFWVPHSEAPYNGVKSVCPFFFYANPNLLGWIQSNLMKGQLSHKWGVLKNIYFLPFQPIELAKLLVKSVCLSVHLLIMLSPNLLNFGYGEPTGS